MRVEHRAQLGAAACGTATGVACLSERCYVRCNGSWGCLFLCSVQICGSQKLLDQFVESNKLLDSVQKGLADYLETKRLAFARWVSALVPACCTHISLIHCRGHADTAGRHAV